MRRTAGGRWEVLVDGPEEGGGPGVGSTSQVRMDQGNKEYGTLPDMGDEVT
jgi:hypothetical protein